MDVVVFRISRCFLLCPLGWEAAAEMCIAAHSVSMSVLVVVSVTDGAADSGELDLSGIDDSEIELVRTCCLTRSCPFQHTPTEGLPGFAGLIKHGLENKMLIQL